MLTYQFFGRTLATCLLLIIWGCSPKTTSVPRVAAAKPSVPFMYKDVKQATLEDIMADAQQQKKVVFIDFYTTWCGPCKWMDENVFTQDDVKTTFNKNFITYKVDAEDFDGVNTALKYSVSSYPTFVFVNPNGQVLHRIEGMIPHESFMQVVTEVMQRTQY